MVSTFVSAMRHIDAALSRLERAVAVSATLTMSAVVFLDVVHRRYTEHVMQAVSKIEDRADVVAYRFGLQPHEIPRGGGL